MSFLHPDILKILLNPDYLLVRWMVGKLGSGSSRNASHQTESRVGQGFLCLWFVGSKDINKEMNIVFWPTCSQQTAGIYKYDQKLCDQSNCLLGCKVFKRYCMYQKEVNFLVYNLGWKSIPICLTKLELVSYGGTELWKMYNLTP